MKKDYFIAIVGWITAPQINWNWSTRNPRGLIKIPLNEASGATSDVPNPARADFEKGALMSCKKAFKLKIMITAMFFKKRNGSLTRL